MPFVPITTVPILVVALTANAAGSVGDFIVVIWLLALAPTLMICDTGPKLMLYKSTPPKVTAMYQRWLKLIKLYGVEQDAARLAFDNLANHYSEDGRFYHTLDHAVEVLDTVESLASIAEDLPAIELAAWFHDVIYDPRGSDNEAKSADYAQDVLRRLGLPEVTIARVRELILATSTHLAPAGDIDAKILLDADLAPLGSDRALFERQTQALRQEYLWIPEPEYNAKRAQTLAQFLERKRIYQTEQIYAAREAQARTNISSEIERLS